METAHQLLMRRRATAKRRRDLVKRFMNQRVYQRVSDTLYVPVTLKGRSTKDLQKIVVWSPNILPKGVGHVCPTRIVTREEIPHGFTEVLMKNRYEGAFVLAVTVETQNHPEPEKKKMASVIQEWVSHLPFMQQSVLLSSIRGPDGQPKYNGAKMLLRWYRRCVLISSLDNEVLTNPFDKRGGSFTGPSFDYGVCDDAREQRYYDNWHSSMSSVVSEYIRHLDGLPSHFTNHFREACEVLGYRHPDPYIRDFWYATYVRLVKELNLHPETQEQMNKRLGDNRAAWLESSDPATQA
jgi:hypothetical protein